MRPELGRQHACPTWAHASTSLISRASILVWVSLLCAPASAILWAWFYHHPVLLYASGYQKPYWLEPLQQLEHPWSMDTLMDGGDYFTLNWDGERIYIDGNAAFTGSPYAPAGAFIVAALPHGFGLAWGSSAAEYGQMIGPVVIPYFLFAGLLPCLAVLVGVIRKLKGQYLVERGRCGMCGYDLSGNVSGTCPECGRRVKESKRG